MTEKEQQGVELLHTLNEMDRYLSSAERDLQRTINGIGFVRKDLHRVREIARKLGIGKDSE